MAYASSTTYLLYLQDYRRDSIALNQKSLHVGLYNYKGKQIELFHRKWFNCGEVNRTWVEDFVKYLRLVLVYKLCSKFSNNFRTLKYTKSYRKLTVFDVAYQQRI